ncbi:MAG: hypothetical protein Aurels2KO_56670 [Aureliella sp.]
MLCFEVKINGELSGIIGYDDALSYGVDVSSNPTLTDELALAEGYGSSEGNGEMSDQLSWFKKPLYEGDILTIEVVRSESPDAPLVSRHRIGFSDDCVDLHICSNCGKSQFEIERLVASSRVALCGECVAAICEIANEQ